MISDTIAAIATSMNKSGIGIIRVSGDDAVSIVDKCFVMNINKRLVDMDSHTINYGFIVDGDKKIDEVLVLIMKAPRSYTAEDTVEIDCHGGPFVMKRIMEIVVNCGARPAEPGEFTKRAFLNGRIDLSQAESVIDIISSQNDFALKSSLDQLSGSVSIVIKKIREIIIHEVAFIESALDDPEHISLLGYPERLYGIVDNQIGEVKKMLDTFDRGRILKEGISTVIVGKPNAGKSSLLNYLLGEERAIVTDIAGTTRDIIKEQINIDGIILNIIDTAGIRNTEDVVEKIGVDRAKIFVNDADLILFVVDSSTSVDDNDLEIFKLIKDKKSIILLNKTDLFPVTSEADIIYYMKASKIEAPVISISVREQTGVDNLISVIKDMFIEDDISYNDQVYITNIRHKNALSNALTSLKLVINSIDNGMPEDFYTIDLMNAYKELGTIIGEEVEDDLVNEIFSKFCMGK